MKLKIASVLNYLAAGLALVFGMIYLTKSSFMSYHEEAIAIEWNQLEAPIRFVILAFMRVMAGCFLTTAIALLFLQYQFTKERITWIPLLILLIGTAGYACTLYGSFIVKFNTTANSPVLLVLLGLIMIIIA